METGPSQCISQIPAPMGLSVHPSTHPQASPGRNFLKSSKKKKKA